MKKHLIFTVLLLISLQSFAQRYCYSEKKYERYTPEVTKVNGQIILCHDRNYYSFSSALLGTETLPIAFYKKEVDSEGYITEQWTNEAQGSTRQGSYDVYIVHGKMRKVTIMAPFMGATFYFETKNAEYAKISFDTVKKKRPEPKVDMSRKAFPKFNLDSAFSARYNWKAVEEGKHCDIPAKLHIDYIGAISWPGTELNTECKEMTNAFFDLRVKSTLEGLSKCFEPALDKWGDPIDSDYETVLHLKDPNGPAVASGNEEPKAPAAEPQNNTTTTPQTPPAKTEDNIKLPTAKDLENTAKDKARKILKGIR